MEKRKYKVESRNIKQTIRLTKSEKEEIERKSKELFPQSKDNLSRYIRHCLFNFDSGDNILMVKKELKEIKYQIRKIGVNINQIAKVANETDYIYQKEFIEITRQLLIKTEEMDKKISTLLKGG